jgi:branched-chain amino acid transport system substrate-binding protein
MEEVDMNYSWRALAIAGAIALIAAGSAPRAATGEPFTIPVIVSLTGTLASLGEEEAQTLRLVETQTNSEGGINGRPVHFDIHDDATNPQVAVQLTNQIMATHAQAILGTTITASCGAMAPLVTNGPVMYCLSPAITPALGGYMFSAGVSGADISKVMVRNFRQRGWKRIAIITTTDASGQDGLKSFDAAVALPENHDITVVAREQYAVSDLSVAAQVSRILQAKPQAIFAWASGTGFGTFLVSASQGGIENIPIATSTGNMTYAAMHHYATLPNIKDVYEVGFRYFARAQLRRGPLKDEIDKFYRVMSQAGIKPDSAQGYAWDAPRIIISAYRHLGTNATAAQIQRYIWGLRSYVGINGIYNYSVEKQRGLNDSAGIVTRWDPAKDGWSVQSRPGGDLP